MPHWWDPNGWHWLALAAPFALLSLRAPWRVLIVLALAASGVALSLAVYRYPWYGQVGGFLVLAVIGFTIWLKCFRLPNRAVLTSYQKRRMAALVGRQASLLTPIRSGKGRLQLQDALWKVTCERDLPAGQLVEVVGYSDTTLHVVSTGHLTR